MNKSTLMRTCALMALALCFLFFSFSVSLDLSAADHDCCGEGCLFCLFSSAAEHAALLPLLAFLAAFVSICFKNRFYFSAERFFVAETPVFLKVKLSD